MSLLLVVVVVVLPVVLLSPPGLEVAPLEFCKERMEQLSLPIYFEAPLWHFLVLHHWKSVRRGQTGVTFGHLEVSRNGTTPSQKYLKETKVYNEKQWTFLQLLGQERDEAQERQN